MRCYICDKSLSEAEIVYHKHLKTYEPCKECLDISLEAAFSQGFKQDDGGEIPQEIGDEFGDGVVETLDTDVQLSEVRESLSWGDASDIIVRYDYE